VFFLGFNCDGALELGDHPFGGVESEPDAFLVDLTVLLIDLAEELE